jgi:hypothetical protein
MTRTLAELPEERDSLWSIAASPMIWAAHFLLSYVTAAVWCAKFAGPAGADASLGFVRAAIAVYSVLGLVPVVLIGVRAFQRQRLAGAPKEHDSDSSLDRHRFLAFATLLLSGLSAVAIVYAALAAVFIESCR